MGFGERLDEFQRRHSVVGFPVGLLYKFLDDLGHFLSALLAYYALLSLFPATLLLTTVLGILFESRPELQAAVVAAAYDQLPAVGEQLAAPGALDGGWLAWTVGLLGSVYGGLGFAQALQHACNTMWAVPRQKRPNPLLSRARSLLILVAVFGFLLALVAQSVAWRVLGEPTGVLAEGARLAVKISVTTGFLVLFMTIATARRTRPRSFLPGALLYALVWEVLQRVGAAFVGLVIDRATNAAGGVFAVVIGLVVFFHVAAMLFVLCAEVNVVLKHELWPRALLTPIDDDVDLTGSDRRSYGDLARRERIRPKQSVEVEFDEGRREGERDDSG